MKAFAALYRRIDAATSIKSKQQALGDYLCAAVANPEQRADAAWAVYFLAGGKPRQTAPTRLLRRLALEESELPEWLFDECYQTVGDLAETIALLLPDSAPLNEAPLNDWMRDRLLPLRALGDEDRYVRLRQWSRELPPDERLAFFKLITGEFRVGVSKLQVVQALSKAAAVDETRMAQRMMGYTQAGRSPTASDFAALIAPMSDGEEAEHERARPYPFYLAQSLQLPLGEIETTLGPLVDWIVEWKFDGIRAQFVNAANGWTLWSRGEELITESYPELQSLALALPHELRLDGELVVMGATARAPNDISGLRPFSALQQRLGRKVVTLKTRTELPVVFVAYDLLQREARDLRGLPQEVRRAALESVVAATMDKARAIGEVIPLRVSPIVNAGDWAELALMRQEARERGVEGLMLKARRGAYGAGRRKGNDRTDVWWKWKIDPLSVDAVLVYAERGHGRRAGIYSDYTFALWDGEPTNRSRTLVPFAKAYSGLSDAEMREVDAIVRKTTTETFGPVRSVSATLVFELGFEGIAESKRHKSGIAVRFPRMLRWRRDKPVAEADTLSHLRGFLHPHG